MDYNGIKSMIEDIDCELAGLLKRRLELTGLALDAENLSSADGDGSGAEKGPTGGALSGYVAPILGEINAQSEKYTNSIRESKVGRFALIGRGLAHSYSPQVHARLGLLNYGLLDVEPEELEGVLHCEAYRGFNVTAPYKGEVMQYCDEVSDEVLETGCANTVVRAADGRLSCWNTDLTGFMFMVKLAGIELENKKVIILGSGATSDTARTAARMLGAGSIYTISRSGEYNYDNLDVHSDAQVIINATPVGMYPHNLETIIDLSRFPSCEGVVDVIYNPHRTMLLMDAEKNGIKYTDGLPMLIYQAKASEDCFFNRQLLEDMSLMTLMTYHKIRLERENIVLIGMPGCGKTTIGRLLAKKTGKRFIDTDAEMQRTLGHSAAEIIVEHGEDFFRRIEAMIISAAGRESGCIIATGGGAVTIPENYYSLHQNGRIYCLGRDVRLLETDGRPLSVNVSILEKMLSVRQADYHRFADVTVDNNGSAGEAVRAILEDFNEISYY